MSILGSVQYEFEADARPLLQSSKEAIRAFGEMDKAAGKADTSIKGVEKSHSVLGKAIKATGVAGVGLFAKHLLEGTKAGDSLNRVLASAGGHLKTFGGYLSAELRPLRAWATSTEAGTKAITTLEKGVAKAGEGFQRFDQLTAKGAQHLKTWASDSERGAKASEVVAKTVDRAKTSMGGLRDTVAQTGRGFGAWAQETARGTGAAEKLSGAVAKTSEKVKGFGAGIKGVVSYLDEVGEGMTAVELGAFGMTGKLGKAAVVATHFSDILGMAGAGMTLMGGKIGLLGTGITALSAGVSGVTGLLGGLVEMVGMAATAIGERLLATTEVWIERFAEAQITILGFNRAVQAYNTTTKEAPIVTEDLEKSMSALSKATGTATVDIRQTTLRALELTKVTGLSTNQVEQLTERSIDLASAMHRDLWDAVWSVMDAMRGFPMMASGFGIALDAETLKTSEFTKALKKSYESLTDHQKSQVMFQELMKQSAWAAGIAAETLDTTLVGAARRSEQAFSRLHAELGRGAAVVWQPYTSAIAEMVSTFNLIPAGLVQAAGAFVAFGGVALKVVGRILEVAGALVTFNVAVMAIGKGLPLLGKGLAWVLTHIKGVEVAFKGWGQILGVLAGTTLVGFRNILVGVAKHLKDLSFLLLGFARMHPVLLALAGVASAFLLVKKAIDSQKKSLEETLKIYDMGIEKEKERISSLEKVKEALSNTSVSEKELRDLIFKAKEDYPDLLKFLDKEKFGREELLVTLDKIIELRKEEEKYLKSKATQEVGKELGFYRDQLERVRQSTASLIRSYVSHKKALDEIVASQGTWSLKADEHQRWLVRLAAEIQKNSDQETKLAEQERKLTAEWERRHGVVKGVEQTLIRTATLQQHLITTEQENAEDFKQTLQAISDDLSKFEELRAAAYQGRTALIRKSLDFEREHSEATQEALRQGLEETFEYEQFVRKGRERELSSFNATIVSTATQASKGSVDAFALGAKEYFSFLDQLQREGMETQGAAASAFSANAKRVRATVMTNLGGFKDYLSSATADAAEAQEKMTENAGTLLMGLSGAYREFSDLAQEAYAKISGSQRNYLVDLEGAGVATRDLASITLSSVVQIEESYGKAVQAIKKANQGINEYGASELTLAEQEKQLKELNIRRLGELGEAWRSYYQGLKSRQAQMVSAYKEALLELRGLEEDRLRRSQAMEEIIRDLREKAGEIQTTAQEKFYAKLRDQDDRLLAAQKLGARDRIKINEDVIQALTGMVGEVQEASGKVILTEKEVAQIILQKVKGAWEATRQAEREAAMQTQQDLDTRKKDLQEVQDQIGVAQAGMAAFQEAHKRAVTGMLQDEETQLDKFAQKAGEVFRGIDLQLQSLGREHKINLTLDERYLASLEQRLKYFNELLDDIASGRPITLRGPNLPPPPPKPPAEAPAPPAPTPPAAPRTPAGFATQEDIAPTGRLFRYFFGEKKQQGGQVSGKIPGFGGGDKVLIPARPGQFVVRKEAVSKFGSGLLAALSQVPDSRLGGFQPQRQVPVAVEPGEFIVPQEAVAARGVSVFDRINRMQEGGIFKSLQPSLSAFDMPQEAAMALLGIVGQDDSSRINMALTLARSLAGISGMSDRYGERDRLRQMFQSAGGYITPEEYEELKQQLEQAYTINAASSKFNTTWDPSKEFAVIGTLKSLVRQQAPGGKGEAGGLEQQPELSFQERFGQGQISQSDAFRAAARGSLTADDILSSWQAQKIPPRFTSRLLGAQGYGFGEIRRSMLDRQTQEILEGLRAGKMAPSKAVGLLGMIGRTQVGPGLRGRRQGVGGMTREQAISLLMENGLLNTNTLSTWMREKTLLSPDRLYKMLRAGQIEPGQFVSVLLSSGTDREEIARLLKQTKLPISDDLYRILNSKTPLSALTAALEGGKTAYGDLGAMAGLLRDQEWAPTTNYSMAWRNKSKALPGLRQDVDMKWLERAREILGMQTGGMVPSMDGFSPAPPLAVSSSVPRFAAGGRVSAPGAKDMRRSASEIEDLFTEMFSNLEGKAKSSASRLGQALFESLYGSLKDRLIREKKMG